MYKPTLSEEFLRGENEKNRQALKALKKRILFIPEVEFDSIVHPIAKSEMDATDCSQCGNCCKSLNPAIREDEVQRLADCTSQTIDEFKQQYLEKSKTQSHFIVRAKPCLFLQDTLCTIYEKRPASCADYPHLLSEGQKYRFNRTIEQYSVCPIVYRVVEKLKEKWV